MKNLLCLFAFVAACSLTSCTQVPSNAELSSLLESSTQLQNSRQTTADNQINRDELFAAARQSELQGQHQDAIKQYQQVIAKYPDHASALHRLAVLHDTHGTQKESAAIYVRALQLQPNNTELLCDYGYSRYLYGDLAQAESTLKRCLNLDPDHQRANTNLGLILARQHKDKTALAAFQRAGQSAKQAQATLRHAQQATKLSSKTPKG